MYSAKGQECDDLISLRDWLRYAVSRFSAAKLAYGHGTDNAIDEAAFLLLSVLNLPAGQLEPWLDCRLTGEERRRFLEVIEKRIATRKPAPYLVNTAWIQGRRFYVDERVIVPRSYIGELLCCGGLTPLITAPDKVRSVLELCTGSGCLAILAAQTFPAAQITAIDISEHALQVATQNVDDYTMRSRVSLIQSDLFSNVPSERYDIVLANPPYVTSDTVCAFPPEYRAEPEIAHNGGPDGLMLVRRILDYAPQYLERNGVLIVEIGQARDALENAYPHLPFMWLDTEASEGEVFALYAEDFQTKKTEKTSKAKRKSPV